MRFLQQAKRATLGILLSLGLGTLALGAGAVVTTSTSAETSHVVATHAGQLFAVTVFCPGAGGSFALLLDGTSTSAAALYAPIVLSGTSTTSLVFHTPVAFKNGLTITSSTSATTVAGGTNCIFSVTAQ